MRTKAAAVTPDAFGHLHDLFAAFGPVSVRRMFSGAGIFVDGLMFALVIDEVVYLKADDATWPEFEREGCGPFSYATKSARRTVMSYWRMPERLYDDPDELARWARSALAIARRKQAKPKPTAKPKVAKPKPAKPTQAKSKPAAERALPAKRPAGKK